MAEREGEFARLVKLVRDGLEDSRRAGDPIPDVRLEFVAAPNNMVIRVSLGEQEDFIPGVATMTHTSSTGGYRSHDDLAADLLEALALRALMVGRTKEERRG